MAELIFEGKNTVKDLPAPEVELIQNLNKSVMGDLFSENMVIRADNYYGLHALLENTADTVDLCFIDPPYNTGETRWIYNDSVKSGGVQDWFKRIGIWPSNSRDRWLAMMWPRLDLIRLLLSPGGVMFMTINEVEVAAARFICDEIFGARNFVGEVVRKTRNNNNQSSPQFNFQHETVLIYAKDKPRLVLTGEAKNFREYTNIRMDPFSPDDLSDDPEGHWRGGEYTTQRGPHVYPIINPYNGQESYPPVGRSWMNNEAKTAAHIAAGRLVFRRDIKKNAKCFVFKRYRTELLSITNPVNSLFGVDDDYTNSVGTRSLIKIFKDKIFDFPKPVEFIQKIIEYSTRPDSLILDCFGGSGATAHAVLKANKRDAGRRRFILMEAEQGICDDILCRRLELIRPELPESAYSYFEIEIAPA